MLAVVMQTAAADHDPAIDRWIRTAAHARGVAPVARALRVDRLSLTAYLAGLTRLATTRHIETQAVPWLCASPEELPGPRAADQLADPYAPGRPVGEPEPPEGLRGR